MTREHLSKLTLVAAILIAAGCGSSEPGSGGTGGTTTGSTGGASPSGSGGASGGQVGTGGALGTGGNLGSGGGVATGGAVGTGGRGVAGAGGTTATGGAATGGRGAAGQGGSAGPGGHVGTGGAGGTFTGTCTASKAAGTNVSGTGPHKVVVEINAADGIKEGTIYRPMDLGGAEKYPIFVWGEGGCSLNGLSNSAAMGEIASHGYFVIADGTPNNGSSRSMTSSDVVSMGKPLLAYVTWAIAENEKPCSAYYQSLDTTKVGANGFSCGGLMAEGTAGDPRITTWGLNSSGLLSAIPGFYQTVHTPVLIVLGGSSDIAYANGEKDYTGIAAVGVPILLFSKELGHGGDLFSAHGGDFTKIDLAWLNWQLKADQTATGKGLLVGAGCTYCKDSAWEVKSMNVP
ncbi:MAG: hypothetical protein ABUS79_24715 [Pseudomonadota bacterium]